MKGKLMKSLLLAAGFTAATLIGSRLPDDIAWESDTLAYASPHKQRGAGRASSGEVDPDRAGERACA
ncbi:MAG TPA: hypothetical protein VNM24_13950 [Burkholderiales bacterium]|jgi:hypothetical protein|nr:hypothetical protein [Burkholderiales bacterium]